MASSVVISLRSARQAAAGVGLITRAIEAHILAAHVGCAVAAEKALGTGRRGWASGVKCQTPIAVHCWLAVPTFAGKTSGTKIQEWDHLTYREWRQVPSEVLNNLLAKPTLHEVDAHQIEWNWQHVTVRLGVRAAVRLDLVDK